LSTGAIIAIVVVAILLILIIYAISTYNGLVKRRNAFKNAFAQIDVQLTRRHDLIPNLVATVDQAARFEQQTFTQVAEARAGLTAAREQVAQAVRANAPSDELSRASNALSENLRLFVNVAVEAYPTLRANQNFIALQDELTETENRIAVARRDYNEAVRTYNTYIRQFPQAITARVIGAERKQPFEAPAGVEQPPQVQFREP